MSLAGGAFALLGTGSVALSSVHVFGVASRRHPVTLTMSTFCEGAVCAAAADVRPRMRATVFMARIIPSVRPLRLLLVAACIITAPRVSAHDLERTRVSLTFSRDGAFVLDVANDPDWLKLRLERFTGPFSDRVVLWVDGREVRPASVEYIAPTPATPGELPNLGVYRMRGRMPLDARTLRWYYGLVIDPYPMTIRRADGRIVVEEIAGDAWSGTIDLSGQFKASPVNTALASLLVVVALLMIPLVVRLLPRRG